MRNSLSESFNNKSYSGAWSSSSRGSNRSATYQPSPRLECSWMYRSETMRMEPMLPRDSGRSGRLFLGNMSPMKRPKKKPPLRRSQDAYGDNEPCRFSPTHEQLDLAEKHFRQENKALIPGFEQGVDGGTLASLQTDVTPLRNRWHLWLCEMVLQRRWLGLSLRCRCRCHF